ncbi:DUF3784 domain-containing protein [uncultured Winogradskyella sp.]|uniref:DUF3784 domain-containing protein n=1 Tax=uncultured Winogradskyella sp. TaxID=395353 RepID=UPI003517ABE0
MLLGQIVLSLGLIGCAFLVEAFPSLIAGYHMLSKEEKEKIELKKLSLFLKWALIALGVFSLIVYLVLDALELKAHYIFLVNSTIIVLGLVVGSVYAKNKFRKK